MEFEEVRSGKALVYWANYIHRFGTEHLVAPTHKMSYIQLYDLDIKLVFSITLLLAVMTLY